MPCSDNWIVVTVRCVPEQVKGQNQFSNGLACCAGTLHARCWFHIITHATSKRPTNTSNDHRSRAYQSVITHLSLNGLSQPEVALAFGIHRTCFVVSSDSRNRKWRQSATGDQSTVFTTDYAVLVSWTIIVIGCLKCQINHSVKTHFNLKNKISLRWLDNHKLSWILVCTWAKMVARTKRIQVWRRVIIDKNELVTKRGNMKQTKNDFPLVVTHDTHHYTKWAEK